MSNLSPVPREVIQHVNEYMRKERKDWAEYDNREPLDSSGRYSLHALARLIYTIGWTEGYDAANEVVRGEQP